MSDGPYRSLPMRPAWKKVAELAENENFDTNQLADHLSLAVIKDFRREIPHDAVTAIQYVFKDGQADLFPDQRSHDLSNVRRLIDGSPLGSLLLDCAILELADGKVGLQGILNAAKATINDQMQRAARQMEEHYLRHPDSSRRLTINVRQRFQEAINHVSTDDIARQILGIDAIRRSTVRDDGLDDGVPLS